MNPNAGSDRFLQGELAVDTSGKLVYISHNRKRTDYQSGDIVFSVIKRSRLFPQGQSVFFLRSNRGFSGKKHPLLGNGSLSEVSFLKRDRGKR